MRALIWSLEHSAWWRPGSMGYTRERSEAGEYSWEEAVRICRGANQFANDEPHEAIVPLPEEGKAS